MGGNSGISFYDYQSFEQLLNESPLIKSLNSCSTWSVFDYTTIEQYFNFVLQAETKNVENLEYRHGRSLAAGYLVANPSQLFDSGVGHVLLEALQQKTRKTTM